MNGQNPNLNNQNQFNGNVVGQPVMPNAQSLGSVSSTPNPQPMPNMQNGGINASQIPNQGNINVNPQPMPNVGVQNPAGQIPDNNPTPNENPVNPNGVNVNLNMNGPSVNPASNQIPNGMNNQVNLNPGINNNQNPMPNNVGLNQVNASPVARPIPGTENNAGNLGTGGLGNYVAPKKGDNIGTVPPNNTSGSENKKSMNKVVFIILIVALIALVAFGVYYFLSASSKKVTLTPKTVNIGVGEPLTDKLSDYVTVTKGDIANCKLNNKNVDATTIGEYPFTVTCNDGKDTFNGKVIVSDKTAPVASLNTVFKQIEEKATIEEFVKECSDPSECKTSFVDENSVLESLKTSGGPKKIEIKAEDNAGNSANYEAELYVTPAKVLVYTSCSSTSSPLSGYSANKVTTDIFPIGKLADDAELTHFGMARRVYKYVFEKQEEYDKAVGTKSSTITFDGVTGSATYLDNEKTFMISTDLSMDTLNSENGGAFPTNYMEFYNLYGTTKGYVCGNQTTYQDALK